MFDSPWAIVLILLVVGWIAQFGLTYFQMRNYYRRLAELRKDGLTAVGLGGGRYKGRTYGVLVTDEQRLVIHAERFSGATVFAKLKAVPELVGQPLTVFLTDEPQFGLSAKLWSAFQSAATDLLEALEGEEAQAVSDENAPAGLSLA